MNNWYVFDLDNTLYPEFQFSFAKLAILLSLKYQDLKINNHILCEWYFSDHKNTWIQLICEKYHMDFDIFIEDFRRILQDPNFPVALSMPREVERILLQLREKNCLFGVITNGSPKQQKQKIMSLSQKIELLPISIFAQESNPKPNPSTLIELMREKKLDPKNGVFVGDSQSDLHFAQNSGVNFLFANSFFEIDVSTYGFTLNSWLNISAEYSNLLKQ